MVTAAANATKAVKPVTRGEAAAVARYLGETKNDLGIEFLKFEESEMTAKLTVKPVEREKARQLDAMNVKLSDVAFAAAGKSEGKLFLGEFGGSGLMLASESSPERRKRQLDKMAGASIDELQAVARVNSRSYKEVTREEAEKRFDQVLVNYPQDYAKRLYDTSNGQTVEGNRKLLVDEFSKENFDVQRNKSMKDGQPVTLTQERSRFLASIKRGWRAIASEIQARGAQIEVQLGGRDDAVRANSSLALADAANAPQARPAQRRVRDGASRG